MRIAGARRQLHMKMPEVRARATYANNQLDALLTDLRSSKIMKHSQLFIVFICLGISTMSLVYGATNTTVVEVPVIMNYTIVEKVQVPVIVNRTVIEIVEIPVFINQTVTQIEFVEIPVIINQTKRVPIPTSLMDFPTRSDFLLMLINDKTNLLEYSDRFTCMDYVLRFIENAEKAGYRVLFLMEWKDDDNTHALGMVYIEDEAKYIVFEPQTDKIMWEWASTRGG